VATLFSTNVHADPSDPFGSLPNDETRAPDPVAGSGSAQLEPGPDGSVSYTVPIDVPPGRAGLAPSLALSYSSSAPLRGGVAAGWSLTLPHIERDPAYLGSDAKYLLDSGDGDSHLVEIPPPSYAQSDTRYFRLEFDDGTTQVEAHGT